MNKKEVLYEIIRSEIFDGEAELSPLSLESISALCEIAEKHDISHILASFLCKKGLLGDDGISQRLQKSMMLAIFRREKNNYAVSQVSDILANASVPHIPLKGSVICRYYPQEWMRTSCDIDVLIKKEDSQKAIDALCKAGYARQKDLTLHDFSLMSPGGVHLELHYCLTADIPNVDKILDAVWSDALSDGAGQRMSNEMFIFYHIAHMAKHFMNGGCGIRPFIDLKLIESNMNYDKERLNSMLDEADLRSFFIFCMKLSEVWFGQGTHDSVTEKMERFVLTGGIYGNTANSAKVKEAKGKGKEQTFFELMFLPRANLEIIYPKLKKYPFLFPFYQAKRWFRILDKRKREKVHNLTAAHERVSKDDMEATSELLKTLGILDRS